MMNEDSITQRYNLIASLLQSHRLREAQASLSDLLKGGGEWELRNRLEQSTTTYTYMLQYMRQGIDDPDRPRLYDRMLAETWEIADQARLHLLSGVSTRYYVSLCARMSEPRSRGEMSLTGIRRRLEAAEDAKSHENAQGDLVLSIWSNSCWSADETAEATNIINQSTWPMADLCLMVSAVTLSVMECFDERKVAWLADACLLDDMDVSLRALIGLVITLHRHPHRIPLYPALHNRISLIPDLTGRERTARLLLTIYLQLLCSKETEKVDKQIREEIIPGMMKTFTAKPDTKLGLEGLSDDNDVNPDWLDTLHKTGLYDKLRRVEELQNEGADIGMGAFSHMKGYPFFSQLSNWLLPFDLNHPALPAWLHDPASGGSSVQAILVGANYLCNSDKYSVCFMVEHLTATERDMMINHILPSGLSGSALDEALEAAREQAIRRPEDIIRQYIHDLYRVLKVSPWHTDLHDIFAEEILLHNLPVVGPLLSQPPMLREVATHHLRHKHYLELLAICNELVDGGAADADTYQKQGYCQQKAGDYVQAIAAYQKADLLKPDHAWTLRHLATCYRQLRRWDEAMDCYQHILQLRPDSPQAIALIGGCLAEQERWNEALTYFFRLNYLEENNLKVWRAIAWCSFAIGQTEQAMRYYDKLLAQEPPSQDDLLNAGHVAWALHRTDQAITLYSRVVAASDFPAFRELFSRDCDFLIGHGFQADELPLVLDMVWSDCAKA